MADAAGYTIMMASQWKEAQMMFGVYQITAVLLFFVLVGVAVLFKDAFPFLWARFVTHEIVVGVLDKSSRKITMNKDFKKLNGVFYYKGEPLPFVKVYPGNFFFAGYPFDILDVDIKTITDPRYRKMCQQLKSSGYPNINALEKALMFSQMDKDDPRVEEIIKREHYDNYEDAKKHINPKNLTVEHALVREMFSSIPLSDMIEYGATVPSEDLLGEVDDIYESRKPSMKFKREMEKMVPICIGVIVAFGAAALAYSMFFK